MVISMRRAAYLFVWTPLLVGVTPAAASIEIIPSVLVSQYWSDNLSLAADELREGGAITDVSPGVAVTMRSRRHRGVLDARYQHLSYRRSGETRGFQQFSASTNSELAADFLFLDLAANRTQSAISDQQAVAANNLSLTSNRTDVSTYSINPYLLKQWSSHWRTRVDYAYRDTRFNAVSANDSQTESFTALASYAESGDILSFDLSFNAVRTESQLSSRPAEFDEVRLNSRYQMNPNWAWLLNVGYEEDRYDRATVETTRGGFGEIGFEAMPTRKISINALIGEHYFGDTAALRLLYRYNLRTGFEAGYRTDITQSAIEVNRANAPATVISLFDNLGDNFLLNEVFEIRRSDVRAYYQWARSRGEISAYHEIRNFQLSLNREVIDSVAANWNWSMTAKSTLEVALSVRDRTPNTQPESDRLTYALVRIESQPRRMISVGGEYSVTSRSGSAIQEYRQQLIGLFVNVVF